MCCLSPTPGLRWLSFLGRNAAVVLVLVFGEGSLFLGCCQMVLGICHPICSSWGCTQVHWQVSCPLGCVSPLGWG